MTAAGLLEKKDGEDSGAVIGPSMPVPEHVHSEVCAPSYFHSDL